MINNPPQEGELFSSPSCKLAYVAALKYLAGREYSRRELSTKLQQKGFSVDDTTFVLNFLEKKNYQSDERRAESIVRHYFALGYGPRKIEAKFYEKGIDKETAQNALSTIADWETSILKAIQRQPKNLYQFLERRGFLSHQIQQTLKKFPQLIKNLEEQHEHERD